MRKERLKQEILEIIGSAILSGTEEAIIRAGIKMIVGMLSYMYNLEDKESKEIEKEIKNFINNLINKIEKKDKNEKEEDINKISN